MAKRERYPKRVVLGVGWPSWCEVERGYESHKGVALFTMPSDGEEVELAAPEDVMENIGSPRYRLVLERVDPKRKPRKRWKPCDWVGLGMCPKCGHEHGRVIPGYPPTEPMVRVDPKPKRKGRRCL